MISKFFIEHPVLANVLAIVLVVVGAVSLYPPARLRISERGAPDRPGDRELSRRQRPDGDRHRRAADRESGQRRRPHAVHAVDQRARRHLFA